MMPFAIFNQHVSLAARASLSDVALTEPFAALLEQHRRCESGQLGPEQAAINRSIKRRWEKAGRQNVDETIRSEFTLDNGLTLVILTCRHFTTVFAKDEFHDWSPDAALVSTA
jgi:hypothetical protein